MAGQDLKFAGISAALDFVGVTVALGASHRQRTGGDEFFDGNAVGFEGDAAAFGLRDRKQVLANASETDGLGGGGAGIGDGHLLGGEIKDAEGHGDEDE